MLLDLGDRGGSAGSLDMIINAEDHLFISVTEPEHGLLDSDAGRDDHGAVSMAEVMRTEADRMTGRSGQDMEIRLPGAVKGGL